MSKNTPILDFIFASSALDMLSNAFDSVASNNQKPRYTPLQYIGENIADFILLSIALLYNKDFPGVNINELLLSQPDTGEQALEICEALVRSEAINIVVIDSVAALVPQAEIEGEMGDSHVGLQARLMSQALRKLTAICATIF